MKRPLFRSHGGKFRLAPWIISHFPKHLKYIESCGGAGSVLLQKERSRSEIWNDINDEIVNLFRACRERGDELRQAVVFTPYSRTEYANSFLPAADCLEQARRTLVRSFMGFGSNSLVRKVKSGFRAGNGGSGCAPSNDWRNFPEVIPQFIERLRGATIENMDACELMLRHDEPDALHYCDPPYVHATRTKGAGSGSRSGYDHEMTDDDHRRLAETLHRLTGKVVLSGYHCQLYDQCFADWWKVERPAHADGARPRTEVLWMNFNPQSAIANPQ